MSGRRRAASALCLLAGALLGLGSRCYWIRDHAPTPGSIAVSGRRLPALPVADSAGNMVDLSQLVPGRRTVIAFYSSSCHTCQVVLPELRPFPPGLRLLLVSEDAASPSRGAADAGLAGATLFHDRKSALTRSFPLTPLPTILFVDEQGVLRSFLVGAHGRDRVQAKLKAFAEGGL